MELISGGGGGGGAGTGVLKAMERGRGRTYLVSMYSVLFSKSTSFDCTFGRRHANGLYLLSEFFGMDYILVA